VTEAYEEFLCGQCAGSGEGASEFSRCHACKGTGTEYVLVEAKPFDKEEADE
jgi:predicted RNA-binding Zn-ribbon protein involved in translation (DUF1610 family)